MKKVNVVMSKIGFNEDSSTSVQEAFIKHLVENSNVLNTKIVIKNERNRSQQPDILNFPVQLEFDFDEEDRLLRKKA